MDVPTPHGVFVAYGVFMPIYLACPSRFNGFNNHNVPFYPYNRSFTTYHGVSDDANFDQSDVSLKRDNLEKILQEKHKNNCNCIPFFAPDEILRKFPPMSIVSTVTDACLDENVEFAKRLKICKSDIQFVGMLLINHYIPA